MSLADTLLLVLMSPVTEKHSIEWPVRTKSTESVTDRIGVIGFLPILNTEARWENRDLSDTLRPRHLQTAVYGIMTFFSTGTQKGINVYPKVIKCSFKNILIRISFQYIVFINSL